MTLDAYYRFEQAPAKSRRDLTASTTEPEHLLRSSKQFLYLSQPSGIHNRWHRNPHYRISNANGHLTCVYLLQGQEQYGYGDLPGTEHALLFVFGSGGTVEVFVAKGRKREAELLCERLQAGEFVGEIEGLRKIAQNRSCL